MLLVDPFASLRDVFQRSAAHPRKSIRSIGARHFGYCTRGLLSNL
jgi:hypothetical protein